MRFSITPQTNHRCSRSRFDFFEMKTALVAKYKMTIRDLLGGQRCEVVTTGVYFPYYRNPVMIVSLLLEVIKI
jgi:hypothetical protein